MNRSEVLALRTIALNWSYDLISVTVISMYGRTAGVGKNGYELSCPVLRNYSYTSSLDGTTTVRSTSRRPSSCQHIRGDLLALQNSRGSVGRESRSRCFVACLVLSGFC